MVDDQSGTGVLRTVGAYLVVAVALHPVLLVLLGAFGILLTAPATGFGPSVLARIAPEYEGAVSLVSWVGVVVGAGEIGFYYGIWPRIRPYVR